MPYFNLKNTVLMRQRLWNFGFHNLFSVLEAFLLIDPCRLDQYTFGVGNPSTMTCKIKKIIISDIKDSHTTNDCLSNLDKFCNKDPT